MRAIKNKVVIKMDTTQKERYALNENLTIEIARGHNFNLREDKASMAIVLYGENIPEGAEILVHHNTSHESNLVIDHQYLTQKEELEGWKIFSIDADMAFAWNDGSGWNPCYNYLITMRIFKPYQGKMVGIEHQQVENRLYIVKGFDEYDGEKNDISGQVACVTKNSDYEIIWHSTDNKEHRLIRTRWREIEAIDNKMLSDLKKGKYLVGRSYNDCKTLNHERINN